MNHTVIKTGRNYAVETNFGKGIKTIKKFKTEEEAEAYKNRLKSLEGK